jgi:hypothetical protein
MTTITNEFQQKISAKIESAFIDGTGHYFMQKNNFDKVIAVCEYSIEHYENKGYELFILDNYNRPQKPIVVTKKDSCKSTNLVNSKCMTDGYYDEFPDAYNQIL